MDYAEWQTLRRYPMLNWNMGMVYRLVERDQRIYPQGELARRTIGLTGDKGNYGIEEAYREELAGRDGKALRQRIARGFYGRVAGAGHEDPVDGYDIVTTLDLDLQDVADKALRRQLEAQNAIWGTTIVMEVETGEILAMANLGRSGSSGGSYYERENYALGRSMEPGSTFKLATMLTLLDDAGMSPETTYDTHNGDPVTVGPARNIRDSHRGDHVIGFRRAVASSSNVYFAKAIWDRYGITGKKQEYSDFLHEKLHLGKTVGLERLGERAPSITADWKVPDPGVMLVKMSYGYRVRLAPIQMITFYNAIANGGKMISPVLIRELRRGDRVEERFETQTIASSICSRAALREVQRCLELVCTQGTASLYFKDSTRLRVAAKTGTAQITDARSREGRYYLGSMVAYFPADNPRYTVLTTIETRAQPGKAYYGGPRGTARRPLLPGARQGRRHRPDPPRGRQVLAPRLVRPAYGLGARPGRQPLERNHHEPPARNRNDARRARHGAQGCTVRTRKPRAESPFFGRGRRNTAKYPRRSPHHAWLDGRHNTEIR